MDPSRIAEAAGLLAAARQSGGRIAALPASAAPQSVREAHAIQDEVVKRTGAQVGAYKANAPTAASEGVRGLIYAPVIHASPAMFPAAEAPQCGIEGEVAFRFRRDLPPRAAPYSREEVAGALDACAAIEVVSSRYADSDTATVLDKLADNISNGGLVPGALVEDWRGLDLGRIKVRLTVNGETVVEKSGGHPIGDPLGVAVALVEMMRQAGGVKAGQYVTCGSYTGLRYVRPGDRCRVAFEGLGEAELAFSP
ncbi:2-keto-4-pentenoate hydratase [Roseococcus sp. SYP-B2431]|uniref:2-keto-4-pentenoate hydratase n=1 Tax=Roseococcus sp. SYP-B2431 TaxID=2496640 RepID=UPI00103A28A4|nr:fumarylacetoacetate hydrolase family protein [Roseococcus sp. SYP-B2431]TCI00260.1 2-keto-4-pentenoate hydratase [Roseococcus sp. SYP-B2431]